MRIGIVGFGMMGRQIAQVFAQHGYEVRITDENLEIVKQGLREISQGKYGLETLVEKGKLSQFEANKIQNRIMATNTINELAQDSDIVIEAVYENLQLKQDIFRKLEYSSSKDTLLASNTSTLSIDKIAQKVKKKDRVVGLHFFNPAQITKLVEVVQGDCTSSETIGRVVVIATSLGKTPILAKDEPGFVANRLGLSLFMEASRMLEQGIASVKDVDNAMKLGFNHPMGPFELADFVGLDTRLRNLESMFTETGDEKWLPPKILRQLVNQGYLGNPTTKIGSKGGYYRLE